MPQLYMIIPVGLDGARPDNSLPGGGAHPGNRPPGSWGGPVDPGYGQGGGPVDPGWGWGGGEHPGNRPPGSWDGTHPSNRPPGSGEYPTGGPIIPPQGGTEVPESEYQPLPPPEDIYSQYIVSVWDAGRLAVKMIRPEN